LIRSDRRWIFRRSDVVFVLPWRWVGLGFQFGDEVCNAREFVAYYLGRLFSISKKGSDGETYDV
jgi:hypothetical protein